MVNDEQSPFSLAPSDYQLYCIGEYDEETGVITANELPDGVLHFNTLVGHEDQLPLEMAR